MTNTGTRTGNRPLAARVMAGLLAVGWALAPMTAAAAAPAKPLDRRQAEAVQRAGGQCDELDKSVAEVRKAAAALDAAAEPASAPETSVRDLRDQIKLTGNAVNTVERSLRLVPADHPDARPVTDRIAAQRAALAAATASIEAFEKRLKGALAVGDGPGAKADIATVRAISVAYAPFQLAQDPKQAAELAARVADDVKVLVALREKFKPLVQRGTPEGKEYKHWAESAELHVGQFRHKCQVYVDKGADVIPQAIAKAVATADQAAADRKPDFFGGAVAQYLDMARRNVEVYAAVVGPADPRTAKLRAALADGERRIETLRAGLRQEILAGTKAPADAYRGADKAALRGLIEREWKAAHPKDDVLGVRLVAAEWKRRTGATWSAAWKTWEDFDRSEMQARVIVRTDDKVATVYWVYLTRDHKSNDLLKVDVRTKGGGSDEMLTANLN